MTRLFGTDGIRGVANVPPMDSETALKLGRALAHVVRSANGGTHRILIGKDTRVSGYMLETALESGISSLGVDVLLVGPLPTPGVAFSTRSMRADAGIMISASHNSYEDNGIKIFDRNGFKLPDDKEDYIETLLSSKDQAILKASPDKIGKAFRIEDAIGRYIVFLKNCVAHDCSLEGLRLVVDAAHGAAYKVAPQLFFELGVDVTMIGDRPNGKNINLNCGSLHPEQLIQKVRETKADCGIAFDGDADRVIFCDEEGQLLDGDDVLAMCALYQRQQDILSGNGVVGTVMSNLGLEKLLLSKGIEFSRSSVGDRYVLSMMQERGYALGGEQSGHVIFLDHNTTGDGLLTALKVLAIMKRDEKPLSSYRTLFSRYPQILINVPVVDKIEFSSIPAISKCVSESEKELGDTGRILLRYSGTEKKARVMVECESSSLCTRIAERLAGVISDELGLK